MFHLFSICSSRILDVLILGLIWRSEMGDSGHKQWHGADRVSGASFVTRGAGSLMAISAVWFRAAQCACARPLSAFNTPAVRASHLEALGLLFCDCS